MINKLKVRECVKWAVILPIFFILVNDFIDFIVSSYYNPELPVDPEYDYQFYYSALFSRIKALISAIAFTSICIVFKHCSYTWIATITFLLYEIVGLIYVSFVFDYLIYLYIIIVIISCGVISLPITYIYKRWIGSKL